MNHFIRIILSFGLFFGSSISIMANKELGNEWTGNSLFDFFGSNKEMIVHTTSDEKSLNSILENGLYSMRYLAESRLGPYADNRFAQFMLNFCDNVKKKTGFLELEQIFFAPQGSVIGKNGNVGILVNPDQTYVFNMGYKKVKPSDFDVEQYKKSKILLSTYLKQAKEAEKMQQKQSDCKVFLDPQTAKPFYGDKNENYPFAYQAEIPFNTGRIPPKYLHLIQKDSFDRRSFKGDENVKPLSKKEEINKYSKWNIQNYGSVIGGTVLTSAMLYVAYKWYQGKSSSQEEKYKVNK